MNRNQCLSQKHAEYVNRARGSVTEEKIQKWFAEVYDLLEEHVNVLMSRESFQHGRYMFLLSTKRR